MGAVASVTWTRRGTTFGRLCAQLPLHGTRHQDILETLDNLLEKARRRTPFVRSMISRCRCWVDMHEWMPDATERDTPSPERETRSNAAAQARPAEPAAVDQAQRVYRCKRLADGVELDRLRASRRR